MVTALRQAGFRPHDAVYLPTDHAGADEIIASADLAMVYGGQRVVDKYAADPAVIVNGPGRSKIVITAEQDWRECLDVVVDSVARHGGMACVNATAVLYEGDPAPLAAAVAERLAGLAASGLTRADRAGPGTAQPRAALPVRVGDGLVRRCGAHWWSPRSPATTR